MRRELEDNEVIRVYNGREYIQRNTRRGNSGNEKWQELERQEREWQLKRVVHMQNELAAMGVVYDSESQSS